MHRISVFKKFVKITVNVLSSKLINYLSKNTAARVRLFQKIFFSQFIFPFHLFYYLMKYCRWKDSPSICSSENKGQSIGRHSNLHSRSSKSTNTQ